MYVCSCVFEGLLSYGLFQTTLDSLIVARWDVPSNVILLKVVSCMSLGGRKGGGGLEGGV